MLALSGVLALLCAATACDSPTRIAEPGPSVGQALDAALPYSVTHTVMTSSTGQAFDLASLQGKTVVISDMMTLCQESCPLDTANVVAVAAAAERAGLGRKIVFVSLTIDPARDTRRRLVAFRKLYRPAPADWLVATASRHSLAEFWSALGVYIQRTPDTRHCRAIG